MVMAPPICAVCCHMTAQSPGPGHHLGVHVLHGCCSNSICGYTMIHVYCLWYGFCTKSGLYKLPQGNEEDSKKSVQVCSLQPS
jgi:hypothetical protein